MKILTRVIKSKTGFCSKVEIKALDINLKINRKKKPNYEKLFKKKNNNHYKNDVVLTKKVS